MLRWYDYTSDKRKSQFNLQKHNESNRIDETHVCLYNSSVIYYFVMNRTKDTGIRSIAALAGVSPATVSRVLNNTGRVSPELCRRVLDTVRPLGGNSRNKQRLIAFIVPDENFKLHSYSLRVIEELRREAATRGYHWMMLAADQLDILNDHSIAGVISFDYRNRIAEKWSTRTFPLVCINDAARYLDGIYSVYSDEYSGIRHAVNHLIGFGHRRIGLLQIGGKRVRASSHREDAFFALGDSYQCRQTFFSEWGCVPVADLICPTVVDGALDHLLRNKVTAIIVPGENAIFGLLDAMKRRKRSIPKHLSVVAWENAVSRFITPPLTTVEQNFQELARLAIEILEAQINHIPMPKNHEVPYLFHQRESVTMPAHSLH